MILNFDELQGADLLKLIARLENHGSRDAIVKAEEINSVVAGLNLLAREREKEFDLAMVAEAEMHSIECG